MSQELLINALAALGGIVATVLVGLLTFLSRQGSTQAAHEATILHAMSELIETLQNEVRRLRAEVMEQDTRIVSQAAQIAELRRQLGIGG